MDPSKYDYLEAEDYAQPQEYLAIVADSLMGARQREYLRKAGVSISQWIHKLEERNDELERRLSDLEVAVSKMMESWPKYPPEKVPDPERW